MSGHIQDLWNTGKGKDRVRTSRYGLGKRWRARWVDPSGVEKTKVFTTQDEAKAFLAQVEVDMMRGGYIDPNAGKRTLADYIEKDYLPHLTGDPNTAQGIEIRWRLHIKPHLGHMPLHGIKAGQLRVWAKDLEAKGLALNTRHLIRSTLWSMLEAAVDDELLTVNPLRGKTTKLPSRTRRKVEPWASETVTKFWAELPPRYAILAVLGASLGLRQGETFALSPDDIDFLKRVVHVRRQVKILGSKLVFALPKFRKERDVPLPDEIAVLISAYMQQFPSTSVTLPWERVNGEPRTVHLLVTSRESKPLNRNYTNNAIWKPALVAAGVEPSRENMTHALRHHFASVFLAEGGDIRSLAEYLGHGDPGFTLRTYVHLMPDAADRMRRLMGTRLAGTFPISDGTETAQTQ